MSLFPPIVASSMPAFSINTSDLDKTSVKIYFTLSNYNSQNKNIYLHIMYNASKFQCPQ